MRAALALLLGLAACATADPAADHLGGHGDPVRGAALAAPSLFAGTAALAGQPARAALAAVQMEVIADAFRSDPRWQHEVTLPGWHATGVARAALREAIGIAPDAPTDLVVMALRDAAAALDAGRVTRAEAALTGPAFLLPGDQVLARLARLPPLPRVAEGAAAAAAEIRRRDLRRRA